MSQWKFLAKTSDLKSGQMTTIQIENKSVLLMRTQDKFYACNELCPHEEISLALGALQGQYIKCSLHGSRFDLSTGKAMDEPAEDDLKLYPLKIDGEKILIKLE